MTKEQLKAELLEVRKYYNLKEFFDKAKKSAYVKHLFELVRKYDDLIFGANEIQIKIYNLRFHEGLCLEAVALELGYSTRCISMHNKKLYEYFMTKL